MKRKREERRKEELPVSGYRDGYGDLDKSLQENLKYTGGSRSLLLRESPASSQQSPYALLPSQKVAQGGGRAEALESDGPIFWS